MFSKARQHNSAKLKHSQENFKQVANKYNRARFNNSFKTHTSCKTYISAISQKALGVCLDSGCKLATLNPGGLR